MGPRLLVVCTANICRSPAAQRLLQARLGPAVEVVSRGVSAVPGAPICEASANWVLMNGGGAGVDHVSRQLELADVRASTLVLALSSRHRSAVVGLRPSAQVRTFTLAQAARIVRWRRAQGARPPDVDLPDRLLWLAEELDTYRGVAPLPEGPGDDDIADPHRGVPHAEILPRIVAAVDAFTAPLLVPSAAPPGP